jgi:acetyl esterase/lipase
MRHGLTPAAKRLLSFVGVALIAPVAAQEAGAAVRVVRDVRYAGATEKQTLDLYLPQGQSGFPVIVSIHGGALMEGDKSEHRFIGERFAAAGIGTAVISYRLSPPAAHPAHIQDAAAAFAWVKRHIAEYGGSADRLFVVGHSAGAYLAALLATDRRYLAAHGLALGDIRGVVPVSAFFWVERVAPDRPKSVWGSDPRVWVDASPAHHLGPEVPPALLLYADGDEDWRRAQNEEMARALRAAGNPKIEVAMIKNRTHNSIWWNIAEPGDETAERIVRFVVGAPRGREPAPQP